MKSFRKYILALSAFFVAAVSLSACGGSVPSDSIAQVAGNPITTAAFKHWMFIAAKGQASQAPGTPVIVPDPPKYTGCIATVRKSIPTLAKTPEATLKKECGQVFNQLRDQVMDFLIRAYWYQADAAAQKIKLTDKQVMDAFNSAKAQQFPTAAQFQTFLTQSGQTLQDILYRVRVNQLYMKLIAKAGGTVTPAQIQAYYQSHTSQFSTPESRNIRIVLTKTKASAQQAMAALAKKGSNWNAIAKKFSTDASTKSKGGLLVGVTKGQQDAALDAAAFAAPVGKLSGPVQGQFGFYVFQVVSIKAPSQQTLAQATPTIKQILTQQQSNAALTKVDAQAKKLYLSRTECRSGYVMNDCKGYKAPKTSTTTAPGATTAPSTPPSSSTTPSSTPPPASTAPSSTPAPSTPPSTTTTR